MNEPIKTPLGEVSRTDRNFSIIRFRDRYGTPCTLQQSSVIDERVRDDAMTKPGSSAVWLGVDPEVGQHDGVFDTGNQTRMHLDRKQVKALIAVLEMWVQTGEFHE